MWSFGSGSNIPGIYLEKKTPLGNKPMIFFLGSKSQFISETLAQFSEANLFP